MNGLEPRSSDIGSDRSANCATTTAQKIDSYEMIEFDHFCCN